MLIGFTNIIHFEVELNLLVYLKFRPKSWLDVVSYIVIYLRSFVKSQISPHTIDEKNYLISYLIF